MEDFLTALALLLVIEGIVLALFPYLPKKLLEDLSKIAPERLRNAGLLFALAGVFFIWLLKR